MSSETLERRFAAVGARLKVAEGPWRGEPRIDVRADAHGEYFDVHFAGGDRGVDAMSSTCSRTTGTCSYSPVWTVRRASCCAGTTSGTGSSRRFPRRRGVSGVVTATAALQPPAVRALVARTRPKDPFRRRNAAYVRQGEWFFVPAWMADWHRVLMNTERGAKAVRTVVFID